MSSTSRKGFPIGSRIKIQMTFRDETDTLADPSRVTIQWKTPEGILKSATYAAAEITRDSVGVYYMWITLDQSPIYWFRVTGSGTIRTTTGDFQVRVDPSMFAAVE